LKLTIIIPTYNRKDNIGRVLYCLKNQEIQPQHTVKTILVDDGSDDGTEEIALKGILPKLTYIKRPREHDWNASKPRNQGARAADTDTDAYYFLDSDVMLPPNRIQRLIDDYLQDPDPNRVIIGPYHYMQTPLIWTPRWYESDIANYQQDVRWQSFLDHPVEEKNTGISYGLSCFGGSLLVPRKLFFKAGKYPEDIGAGCEDGSFGLQLVQTGAVFSLDKELLGWHHEHEVISARREKIPEFVKIINLRHFGSEDPDYGLIEASKEAYESWKISWVPPIEWQQEV
jgi:glycosyltransferase involved in cell wall biosynthesis